MISPYLPRGECPCTYCKSLWIRASAKCVCEISGLTDAVDMGFHGTVSLSGLGHGTLPANDETTEHAHQRLNLCTIHLPYKNVFFSVFLSPFLIHVQRQGV